MIGDKSHDGISVSDTGSPQTCRTIHQGRSLSSDQGQSPLPFLRRSKGLSTKLRRVSQSHQLARPPSPQRAPLRLRLLKSYVNVLACVTRSCCISLKTRLVLNSEYIEPFYLFYFFIDVFGAPHLFLSCCTASLGKGAACQSESYDYIYEGKRNFGPFACLLSGALRDTRGFMFNTMSVLDVFTSFFMSF